MMQNFRSGIQLRWINNAGFEVILPDGAHLLIDPWMDTAQIHPLSAAELERVDYVLLTHIHFDHADSIADIQKRFPEVRIIVGDLSAGPLCEWYGVNVEKLYRVRGGEVYEFADVKVEAIAGRHTESQRGSYYMQGSNLTKDGALDLGMWYGSMEMFNYRITVPDGFRLMVWGGMTTDEQINRLKAYHDNDVAVMHVSPKQDLQMFTDLVNAINPSIVIPHHHDLWDVLLRENPGMLADSPLTPEKINEEYILGIIKEAVQQDCPYTSFFIPVHHQWYRFGVGVETVE